MELIAYIEKDFRANTLEIIHQANEIIAEYQADGMALTLRQLYYQFVSRDLIPNTQQSYKRLGSIINDGRMAGLIDWLAIEDRTRELRRNPHWTSPADIIDACVESYRIDKWANQPRRVECWIEKDALVGVIESTCKELDVPYFSCRGYSSQSETWRAGQRLCGYLEDAQEPLIIHLGDHDPSGLDMSRDIADRLGTFAGEMIEVRRIALNMDQIDEFNPPPNPTKITDSRASGYISRYGRKSWELDALDPKTMRDLVFMAVMAARDDEAWAAMTRKEEAHIEQLEHMREICTAT